MNSIKHLQTWLKMNTGRTVALAKKMDCSRQYISRLALQSNELGDSQLKALEQGVAMVELDEAQSLKEIERIILKSAHLSHSKDCYVRDLALIELDKWVERLGGFVA